MPFRYEPYSSPFSRTIADLMLRRGDIAARQAENVGNIQANAGLQQGQAYANAFNTIGQTVAAIPGQIQQDKRRALVDEATRLDLETKKRAAADVTALDTAYKLGDRDKILEALPGHLRPTVMKQFADADAAAGKVQKTRADLDKLNNEYLAGLGASVAEHGYDLSAAGLALQHARNTYEQANDTGMVQRIDQIAQQLQQQPDSIKQVVDGVIALSPERVKIAQTEKHQTAQETQAQAIATETARHNEALEAISKATGDRAAAAQKETARHNAEMERLRGAQIAQGEAAPSLSPDAIALTAKQFAMTGQLPPMGMGKAGAAIRTQIINEAAKQYQGLDLASQKAAYESNKKSLDGLVKQRDALGAFEETATKNLDVFLNAASKVVDTGSPWINKPIRAIAETGLGSADQAAFNTARRTVIPEFAKILANPGLSGQLSDSARKEVEEVVSGNASYAQIVAAAKVLKQDVANRRTSYDDQIKAIQQRIATPPGGPSPQNTGGARERVIGPNGETGTVPAGTPLPPGWRKG